jgi:hypothetical protein
MYSIVVNVYYPLFIPFKNIKLNKIIITVGIKLDGIHESQRNIKVYKTQEEGKRAFEERIQAIFKSTNKKKENEI